VLRIEGVNKSFGIPPRRVLLDACLEIGAGEFVAIMGESGAGKSTLLNLIAGLDSPDSGSILFDGIDVNALEDTARTLLRRDRMGFVFQAFHLLPHLTLAQNVSLPLDLQRVPRAQAADRVTRQLDSVGLASRANDYPRSLSGGEAQRIAICRALVHRPALVLADEPTGNLDLESAAQVLSLLKEQIRGDGAAGILVTHSEAAARTADRVYRLQRGTLQLHTP
jgi:putative ABC transport system ATP-binding protein